MKRRKFVWHGFLSVISGSFALPASGETKQTLIPTPRDIEGPFYPVSRREDEDNRLIKVNGQSVPAEGNQLALSGHLLTPSGQPIAGVVVEIWQTDTKGHYHHPAGAEPSQRDQNFQYWGKTVTTDDGYYDFQTLLPGHYTGRRPHIHFKIWQGDRTLLTSQIYFSNHPENHKMPFWEKRRNRDGQLTELLNISEGNYSCYFPVILA